MKIFHLRYVAPLLSAMCFACSTTPAMAIPPSSSDTVYVGDVANGQILKFTGVGSSPTIFADFSAAQGVPVGLAAGAGGNLFAVVSYDDGVNPPTTEIRQFNPSGASTVFADGSDGLGGSTISLAYRSGSLYVGNGTEILKFDSSGNGSVFASGGGLDLAYGMGTDSSGNLYVNDSADSEIYKYTASGVGSLFASGGSLDSPIGLAVDANGNVFSSNFSSNSILKFTPAGVESIFASVSAPEGIAFNSAGNLLVNLAADEQISIFTPGGAGSLYANAGLGSQPFFIAAVPVPEPSAIALGSMAALGFAAVARKRRKTVSQKVA